MPAQLPEEARRQLAERHRVAVEEASTILAEVLTRYRLDYEDAGLSVVHVTCGQVVIGSWMHAGPPPIIELDYDSFGGNDGATSSWLAPVLKAAAAHVLSCPRQD